jgi:hypothetical protein
MARFALNLGDWIVSTGLQKFHHRRRVRIMTARAGGFGHRIVAMGLLKGRFRALVAGQTERGFLLSQQIGLFGAVRKVADLTSIFLDRLVCHFLLIASFLMALMTSLVSFCF